MFFNSSVYRRFLLSGLIKRARRQLNKKKSVKRLYRRKKLPVSVSSYRQKNRRQLYNVNYSGKLIKRPKLQRRHSRRKKERLNAAKKSKINKKRLLQH